MTVALRYDDEGEGPVLVLLHAFPCDASLWSSQRAAAVAAGWRVVTPDLRGFGGSPLGEDAPDLDRMAEDVLALLDALGIDRCVLGGNSMGGYVAMALLRRRPEVVAALFLCDTKATADGEDARANRERMAEAVLAEGAAAVLRERVLSGLLGATTFASRPEVVSRVEGWTDAARPESVAWAQRAMAGRPDSLPTLAATRVPALVLRGDEDVLSTAADAEAMATALTRSQSVVVPGAGHLSGIEDAAAVDAALVAFLGTVRGPFV